LGGWRWSVTPPPPGALRTLPGPTTTSGVLPWVDFRRLPRVGVRGVPHNGQETRPGRWQGKGEGGAGGWGGGWGPRRTGVAHLDGVLHPRGDLLPVLLTGDTGGSGEGRQGPPPSLNAGRKGACMGQDRTPSRPPPYPHPPPSMGSEERGHGGREGLHVDRWTIEHGGRHVDPWDGAGGRRHETLVRLPARVRQRGGGGRRESLPVAKGHPKHL